jgi:ATP-dependent Clp protease ATP-binding subunit ClpA
VDNELRKVEKQLMTRGVRMEVTDAGKDWLGDKGYDPVFGARPLRRVIQDNIEDKLSEMRLSGEFATGDAVKVDAEDGALKIEPLREPAAVG